MANTPIPVEKVEAMFSAYANIQNYQHVAELCGVSTSTVKKYVGRGDPRRGVEPFEIRLKRLTRLTARKVDSRIVYTRADAIASSWEHLRLLDDVITDATLRYREILATVEPKLSEIAKAIEISQRLKVQLREWSDDEGDDPTVDADFSGWSVEQIEEFAITGTVPIRGAASEPGRPTAPENANPPESHEKSLSLSGGDSGSPAESQDLDDATDCDDEPLEPDAVLEAGQLPADVDPLYPETWLEAEE